MQEFDIFVKEATALRPKIDILLLHGAKFTSNTWHTLVSKQHPDMNTISMLAAAGYRAVAIDLPGTAAGEKLFEQPQSSIDQALFIRTCPHAFRVHQLFLFAF